MPSPLTIRRALMFASLMIPAHHATAQDPAGTTRWADSSRVLIEAGLRSGRTEPVDAAITLLDRVLTVVPDDSVLLHYRGYALYRRATLTGSEGDTDIRPLLEEAEKSLVASARTLPWPETHALVSSVLGQRIGLNPNPINAMRLGPKADAAMERAVELGPGNPRVWLMRGIGAIFKPRLFGGGTSKAEADIRKALSLFPADAPAPPAPAWGHAEAWAWLGQVHVREERFDDARRAYEKALEIDPEFGWVKNVLLPALDRKRAGK